MAGEGPAPASLKEARKRLAGGGRRQGGPVVTGSGEWLAEGEPGTARLVSPVPLPAIAVPANAKEVRRRPGREGNASGKSRDRRIRLGAAADM